MADYATRQELRAVANRLADVGHRHRVKDVTNLFTEHQQFQQSVDAVGGFRVNGTEVITSAGAITADIQATAGSIGTAELADNNVTLAKLEHPDTAGKFIVGAATTTAPTYVAMSGDATLASTGALTIAAASVESSMMAEGNLQYAEVTIGAAAIVGTDAGDIGATAGAPLVAAQADKILEFVSAVLIYDFATAAYTGGGDDLVIRQGTTAVSAPIAGADLLGDTADDIAYVNALSAADIKLTANSTLNLFSTAWTQPGTAAGVLRVKVTYRVHTAGLA